MKNENYKKLDRNIKLRIILALAVLFEKYTEGREVIELFPQQTTDNYLIATHTFTHDCFTGHRNIKLHKVFDSLSDFEAQVIYEFLCNPEMDKFLQGENHLQQEKYRKIEKARTIFSQHFPYFPWS